MTKKRIALISTGGTIEKTYDELSGVLANQVSVLDVMLASLRGDTAVLANIYAPDYRMGDRTGGTINRFARIRQVAMSKPQGSALVPAYVRRFIRGCVRQRRFRFRRRLDPGPAGSQRGASRAARFVCALAVARGDAVVFETTGTIEGEIADRPRGV